MSDAWATNAGKAASAVGTATIEADDELFTIVGHGLGVGDTVVVDTLTGGAAGVLDEGQVYWIVDVTTDTFAVSQHRNGAPVAFSTDGGADVYRFAPQYTALELRRLDSGLLTKEGDRFGAREGIHPANDPAISVSGTTWTVEDVTGVVYPAISSTSGPYRFAHPTESGSLDPADGTNDRIDALDLQIQDDDEDASGERRARVVYVTGTPAASPAAPSQTANSLRLGTILVPSGGTPSPSVSTDAQAPFTVAAGGVLPVRDDSELPSSPYDGQMAWDRDRSVLLVRADSAWRPAGLQLIAVASPSPPTTSVVFDSIPQDFNDLLIVGMVRSDSETAPVMRLVVNDEATANYLSLRTRTTSSAVSADEETSSSGWRVGSVCGTNSPNVDDFSALRLTIPDYTSSPARTAFLGEMFSRLASNFSESHRGELHISGGRPVTKLEFNGIGQWATGSVIRLYGLR